MTASPFRSSILPWVVLCLGAEAHPNPQNAMWVQFEPSQIHLALDVSLQELSAARPPSSPPPLEAGPESFLGAAQQHQAYILDHLVVSVGTDRLTGSIVKISPPAKMGDPERTFFQYELQYPLPGAPPKAVWFYHDMLKEWPYAPGTAWNISYIVRTKRTGQDSVTSWLLSPGKPMEFLTGWEAESQNPTDVSREIKPQTESGSFKNGLQRFRRLLGL